MKLNKLILVSCAAVLLGCGPKIVDRPVSFDQEREELTIAYLDERYGLQQDVPTIDPKMVVIHWTAIPSLEKSFDAFRDSKLPNWRPEIAGAGALNVSAHFLIAQDGTIYRLMPETTMARHVIGLNHCAIGIENVGGTKETPLTEAQLRSNIQLVEYLSKKYPIDYVIGHHEYRLFEGHPLWLEKDEGYRTEKSDPGDDFMTKVRSSFEADKFKPIPEK
ncbi:N-acetylmuramoyl-L-alanine amidase [Robertkochia aurantiaca]|uniref:N-acetylmuramoyl-L-alanine amidase n=1 Tax=Robertkochia aurantiaca TaxID=2873700 RepID=UPI001CCDBCFA|nr:peptidoglycan recognition family protein [Robertkochia sp. 3YJGBD-33]